jgi:hypothetical protein
MKCYALVVDYYCFLLLLFFVFLLYSHCFRLFVLLSCVENHQRTTLRQTQVLVIPANDDMNDFHVFDQLINAINEARRSARDYVTDHSLEKLDDRMAQDDDRDWV